MSRLPLVSFIALVIMVSALAVHELELGAQTATLSDALASPTLEPRLAESTFDQARPVEWYGHVSRMFVSGEGLEIAGSHEAPGGVFHAYMPRGQVSPVTQGSVHIRGLWTGYTCAYGGHDGDCVPEVNIESIEQLSPVYDN